MTMEKKKFRLVTRSDFDGLVCAVLLNHLDMLDEILFVHPKDMQDGKIQIGERDITTSLPYVSGAYLAFDHHLSETLRNSGAPANHIIDPQAPSAARMVYRYFGGSRAFPAAWSGMMAAVNKTDTAQITLEDIISPTGWVLLRYLMDARTGLGRFQDFRISNYMLMMSLVDYCKDHTFAELMGLPDVKERANLYFDHESKFKEQILRCSKVYGNLVVLDLRGEEIIYAGNRFVIYALFPQCNISIHVFWGMKQQNTVFAVGKSILNRSSNTNVGELMLQYAGGGHENAGTCQMENKNAEAVLQELLIKIMADG